MRKKMKIELELPLCKHELAYYLGRFDDYKINIDTEKSIKNLGSYEKFLQYIYNCRIYDPYIDIINYKHLDQLLLAYISFDKHVYIPELSKEWQKILVSQEERGKIFSEGSAGEITTIIEEIDSFFCSLHYATVYRIFGDKFESASMVKNAEKKSLNICGKNIISLCDGKEFFSYMRSLNAPIYEYDELSKMIFGGYTPVSCLLETSTPYRILKEKYAEACKI